MKRFSLLIIFSGIFIIGTAQWSNDFNYEGKCSHANINHSKMIFNPDYNWQSSYLFDYDVTSYILDIDVSDTTTFVSGNAIINATAIVDIDTFAFELIPEQIIDNLLFNGELNNNFYRDGDNVIVPVANVAAGQSISVRIYYHGQPPEGGFFTGVTTDYNPGWKKHVTWTLSEPFAAKQWFPVKQDLQDKADSAILNFTTASTNMVGSQGLLTKIVDLGNNKTRYEWKTNYPIDYYLISFACADYIDYSIYAHPEAMNGDSLLIQNFLYNDSANIEMKRGSIDKTIGIMELYCDLFNLYPFANEKYGHCEARLGGGMEHQTMSTMGNFGFHLVAHELGHMWFGDNVTCSTWSDIWINEGFATYSDYLANEFILGAESAKEFIIGTQDNAMSVDNGSIYISEDEIFPGNEWRIFSGVLSYDKGASIIHMLRHEIQNDDLFFETLQSFQTNFGGGTATGEDFKSVAEEVTGMDFEYFFDQWYYGQGFPIYSYTYWQDEDKTLFLSSTQTTSSLHTTLFDMLMDYRIQFADGTDTIVSFRQTENLNIFSLPVDKNVANIEVDPVQWTLEKVSNISSVDDHTMSSSFFTIGPNPVDNELNIYFLKPNKLNREIRISNIQGQQVYQMESENNIVQLSSVNLESGIYFISVSDGKSTFVEKFVKR